MLLKMRLSVFATLLATLSSVVARSSTGNSVLVVLEDKLKKEDYSTFFSGLEARGYELTFRKPTAETPKIIEFDVPAFSHIILFAPSTKSFAPDLSPQNLVQMLSNHPSTNLLIALSPKQSPLSTLAAEFGISVPPPNTPLISHFPERPEPHTVLPISFPRDPHPLITKGLPPIQFEGISFHLGDNPRLFPILKAPMESFCTDTTSDESGDSMIDAAERGGEGLWAGSKMAVASGFQANTGARVGWVGGVKLFSNDFTKDASSERASGNKEFALDLASWTFQESLVLKVENATHHLASDPSKTQKDQYTINDQITFTVDVSKYNPKDGSYGPHSSIQDMQMEFTMLDPHIRTALKPVKGEPGKYSLTFRAPDRHGVFKFVVNHNRKGWAAVKVSMPVAIVPPRHDGYPRFLSAAWPYYAGAISTSVGFLLFCLIYLGGEVDAKQKRKAKGKGKSE